MGIVELFAGLGMCVACLLSPIFIPVAFIIALVEVFFGDGKKKRKKRKKH